MNQHSQQMVEPAAIEWRNGTPYSSIFQDYYYHSGEPFELNGLRETEYLFLQHNNLRQRWDALASRGSRSKLFTLGETGFGTGLNFLSAADLWLQTAPQDWRLQFISTELNPILAEDLREIHHSWSQFGDLSRQLMDQYPDPLKGIHLITLAEGRIQLYLMFGEANQLLQQIAESPDPVLANYNKQPVDAWFLDGFAPTKNPELWRDDIFTTLASLSGPDTTFATFTAASQVRKGLANAGFNIQKIPGFGRKRESLAGQFSAANLPSGQPSTPWHLNHQPADKNPKTALILGAGIAGCTTAAALVKRGFEVKVVDRHPVAGQEGSGNLQAILYPRLSLQNDQLPRINLAAITAASRYYQRFWDRGIGDRCGVLLLPTGQSTASDFQQIGEKFSSAQNLVRLVDNRQICSLSGLQLEAQRGLYFPNLGWLPPSQVCQSLLQDCAIPLLQADVDNIDYCPETDLWKLYDKQQQVIDSAEILIIANAHGCRQFSQTEFLDIKPLRGQVSHLPSERGIAALETVICGKGYIAPAVSGVHSCGATYSQALLSNDLRNEDHLANLQKIQALDPQMQSLTGNYSPECLAGRANFRCTSRDYLPIVGPVPDVTAFKAEFKALRFNASAKLQQMGTYLPNLYINCSLGSRGMGYAPLNAEVLAAEISGEIPPLERELRLALHPARFLVRDLKRRKI